MRKKKHGEERIFQCSDYLTQKPAADFADGKKLYLEIGCGKGKFAVTNAVIYRDINFVAIEKISDVILLAMEKAKSRELTNLKFINCDAKNIEQFFGECEVDRIYLNFNDPWPKKGYYKRRLTYKDFLDIYKKILKDNGELCLKTDNVQYFDFSVEQLEQNGFEIVEITRDLHNSGMLNAKNIVTEYEKNFSEKGIAINYLKAVLRDKSAQ